jgi:hypothetical protein
MFPVSETPAFRPGRKACPRLTQIENIFTNLKLKPTAEQEKLFWLMTQSSRYGPSLARSQKIACATRPRPAAIACLPQGQDRPNVCAWQVVHRLSVWHRRSRVNRDDRWRRVRHHQQRNRQQRQFLLVFPHLPVLPKTNASAKWRGRSQPTSALSSHPVCPV